MLNLKRPIDIPYEYTQTRAYDINEGSMSLYEQKSYGDKMSW
jgi:hypothetical protein